MYISPYHFDGSALMDDPLQQFLRSIPVDHATDNEIKAAIEQAEKTTLTDEDRAAIEAAIEQEAAHPTEPLVDWYSAKNMAIYLAGKAAGIAAERERCAKIALEQRCERDTPWDLACTTIAAVIRAAKGE